MYRGFYINLDRNESRRAALTEHLAARGLAAHYERVPAVDGRAAAPGRDTRLSPVRWACG